MLTEGSKARALAFWTAVGFADPQRVPPEFAGVDVRAVEWEAAGWSLEMIAVEARRIGPSQAAVLPREGIRHGARKAACAAAEGRNPRS